MDVREYIYDMPVVMGGADLMLAGQGASTISELTATATPPFWCPLPT